MDRDQGDQRRASLRASDSDREQFVETCASTTPRAASPSRS
jgi:hypothetical protein